MKPELEASCGDSDPMNRNDSDDEVFPLPGFRFHPTDEELVGFYLRRKVEKRPIKFDLIRQVDIYKYDPWELPNASKDRESYFFCKRGRKYRNSIRPNRVTGSGFWKATGIDKNVYSERKDSNLHGRGSLIGLKKTLVYYRGSAGKGSKTDWMMHEFRFPTKESSSINTDMHTADQEAEVWTLCRIFKRNISSRKYTPDWRELASNKRVNLDFSSAASSSISRYECDSISNHEVNLINFGSSTPTDGFLYSPEKCRTNHPNVSTFNQLSYEANQVATSIQPPTEHPSLSGILEAPEFLAYGSWDDLRSVVDMAVDRSQL